jgi:hypothetical protein
VLLVLTFGTGIANIGTAVVLFPILKRQNRNPRSRPALAGARTTFGPVSLAYDPS